MKTTIRRLRLAALITAIMMITTGMTTTRPTTAASATESGQPVVDRRFGNDRPTANRQTRRFNLERPATVDEIVAILNGLDVSRVELIREDSINGLTYTSGYVSDESSIVASGYVDAMAATFTDMAAEFETAAEHVRGSDQSDLIATSREMVLLAARVKASDASITQVVATGSRVTLDAITTRGLLEVDSISPAARPFSLDQAVPGPVVGTEDAGSGGDCDKAWWPYTGRISTQNSSSVPNRYVWQRFKWSQWRIDNLYDCDKHDTSYEQEAWYNNYDGNTFLSSTVQTWSSSLPDGYLDVEFGNGSGELGATIGTGAANQLDANVDYTTYIRTTPGNATTDTGKVNGQRGLNLCLHGFTSGWCILARATEPLLAAWNHPVPGATNWTHY